MWHYDDDIFRDERKIFSVLSYTYWHLHECNATKSIAEIYVFHTCAQLPILLYVVKS